MKKIFTILCLALMAVAANAQKLQVLKDGKIMAEFYGKDGWEFVFDSDETPGTGNMIDGHEYVEIGGVKWATMNIGATTVAGSYKTCFGDYFAMGEKTPRYSYINRKDYKDITVSFKSEFMKGWFGQDKEYSAANDAATYNWGPNWRTPTKEDFNALIRACGGMLYNQELKKIDKKIEEGGIYYVSRYQNYEPAYSGVDGILFVDMNDINKRLFLPAAGYGYDESIHLPSCDGQYFTCTKNDSDPMFVRYYSLHFDFANIYPGSSGFVHNGLSIRPVVK